MTSARVSAAAAVVLACAAVVIPAVLDFQQRESLAKNATVEYYHSVFDSPQGQRLGNLASDAEVFYWKTEKALRARDAALPEDQRKDSIELYREIDKAWLAYLLEELGEHELRKLAVFLLLHAEVVYECAGFRELFKDIESDGRKFRWGSLKLDGSGRITRPGHTYLGIIRDFLGGFFATRPTGFICHRDSVIQLFGRWFSEPFWYLRGFLYCDDFLEQHFFRDKLSDSSSLYRLESVAMIIEQNDMEFRYPDNWPVMMRTKEEADAYKAFHPGTFAYNFRLVGCS